MKKMRNSIFILLLILLLTSASFADSIGVNINGKELTLSVKPIAKEGRTLVPLRAISEVLGAKVDWDNTTKTVTATLASKIIKLQIDNKTAQINGKDILLDVPATIINGSTFIPVRFIAESFDAKVDWDNSTKTVIINSDIKKYKVIRVVDGDTIKINFNGKEESVRLIGIDTPESVHPDWSKNIPEGLIASKFTEERLEGKLITLEFDVQERDHYGRLLAYVWVGGEMFNRVLLEEGYAQIATYPPNIKYVDEFILIQKGARENNKGLWGYQIQSTKQKTPNPYSETGKYIGSKKSDKYHYPDYTHPGPIKEENLIWFDSIEDAESQGYKPCGYCF